jgi:hypothetical protein
MWFIDSFNSAGSGADVDGINKNTNSLGPSPAASNTPAGHTDNAKALRTEFTARLAASAARRGVTATPYFIFVGDWCVSDNPTTGTPADYSTNAHVERWKSHVRFGQRWAARHPTRSPSTSLAFATCSELAVGSFTERRKQPPRQSTRTIGAGGGYDLVYGGAENHRTGIGAESLA